MVHLLLAGYWLSRYGMDAAYRLAAWEQKDSVQQK